MLRLGEPLAELIIAAWCALGCSLRLLGCERWVKLGIMIFKEAIDGGMELQTEPVESAELVGLRYVSDEMPGFRLEKAGKGFRYLDREGKVIREPEQLARINALAIPPAWTDVWICALSHGHLQ